MLVVVIGGATGDQCGEAPSPQTHGNSSAALVNLRGVSHPLALGRERGSLAATLPKGGESGDFTTCRASANATPLINYLQKKRISWYNEFELIDYLGSAKDAFREFGVVRWTGIPSSAERTRIPVGATIYFDMGSIG